MTDILSLAVDGVAELDRRHARFPNYFPRVERYDSIEVEVLGTSRYVSGIHPPFVVLLDNQGAPVHGDKVAYHEARADLRQPREQAVGCTGCLAPTWNHNGRCDDCRRSA